MESKKRNTGRKMWMKSKLIREIQEPDIDILGHVNYTVYIEIMTDARTEWVSELLGTVEEMIS